MTDRCRIAFAVLLAVLLSPLEASATCTATSNQTCSDGTRATCGPATSCHAGDYNVICDGVSTSCPATPCNAAIECPYPPYQPWYLSCSTNYGTCSQTSTSIRCGTEWKFCEDCLNSTASYYCPL